LDAIRKIEYDRTKRIHVIAYEFSPSAPFGITTGAYKEKIFSGYFSIRFNADLIESMRKNYDKGKKSELDVSAGWTTMKITTVPIWGFFGIGYTGVAEWDYGDTASESEKPTFRVFSAISPEIGILGKLGPVALRYTFQYRFALNKDRQDYIGRFGHVFGLGFCF
jgi:hypothetical protein